MEMNDEDIKKIVREKYGKIARRVTSCCGPVNSCCEGAGASRAISKNIGYTEKEIAAAPEGSNLGLGCGNPLAFASLKEGDTLLDLGSGAGFDCFIASPRVGKEGTVIGVDMTREMIKKARANASEGSFDNVEFRLGEIDNLPVADGSVDMVISNCVINLVPDKRKVFRETFRILKPGGRIMVSDIVLLGEIPDCVRNSVEAYVGCLGGAIMKDEYLEAIGEAGFRDVRVLEETVFPVEDMLHDPTAMKVVENLKIPKDAIERIARSVVSAKICGTKPVRP